MTTNDPWLERKFVRREWSADRGNLIQCKFPVEGRRCNAKLPSLAKMCEHLMKMHNYRYSAYTKEKKG